MSLPATLDALTQEYIIPELTDNIFKYNPLFDKLLRKAKERSTGPKIRIPIESDANDNAGAVAKTDTLAITPTDFATYGYTTPRSYHSVISVYGEDLALNSGKQQVIDILVGASKNAEKALGNALANDLYGTQSGNKIEGLSDVCGESGSSLHGITDSDLDTWLCNGGKGPTDKGSSAMTLADIRKAIVDATDGSDGPDLIMTTKELWADFAGVLETKERLVEHAETTKAGFANFTYMGIPVVADTHVPENHLFILNTKHLYFVVVKGSNFKARPFKYAETKDIYYSHLWWRGALVCSKRSAQALVIGTSVSAS